MKVYLNIRKEYGEPVAGACCLTEAEALEASKNKIYWAHGSYTPEHYAIAVPVFFEPIVQPDLSKEDDLSEEQAASGQPHSNDGLGDAL